MLRMTLFSSSILLHGFRAPGQLYAIAEEVPPQVPHLQTMRIEFDVPD